MAKQNILEELPKHTRAAVRFYWQTRTKQLETQRQGGVSDQGLRSAVTGGAQMNGFIELLTRLVIEAGIESSQIFYKDSLELPGYFRPSKRWGFWSSSNGNWWSRSKRSLRLALLSGTILTIARRRQWAALSICGRRSANRRLVLP